MPCIEWAPFRLADNVTEAEFLAASEALQDDFLRGQPGFVSRDLLRDDDGGYVDLVVWQDRASVDAAMARVTDSAACARYFAHLHMDAAGGAPSELRLCSVVRRYEADGA